MHGSKIKREIQIRRLDGISIEELSRSFSVSRGTVYSWVKDIPLPDSAKFRLRIMRNRARRSGLESIRLKREKEFAAIREDAHQTIESLSLNVSQVKVMCAILFWAEGSKIKSSLRFMNSDPLMIKTFLSLLRRGFSVDEKKLRALVHIHSYHDDEEVRSYWSNITGIPLDQFHKSFKKENSGLTKKIGYMGCISISYYDAKIAKELTSLYTTLYSKI